MKAGTALQIIAAFLYDGYPNSRPGRKPYGLGPTVRAAAAATVQSGRRENSRCLRPGLRRLQPDRQRGPGGSYGGARNCHIQAELYVQIDPAGPHQLDQTIQSLSPT